MLRQVVAGLEDFFLKKTCGHNLLKMRLIWYATHLDLLPVLNFIHFSNEIAYYTR